MADRSKIEWTDASWTPIRARVWEIQDDGSGKERIGWHCEHVSEGCRNCYAERLNLRLGTGRDFKPGELYREEREGYHNGEVKVFLDEAMLTAPLRWKKPRMIFVCSMTDLFANFVTDEWIDSVFAVMALCPQHVFQVLTKRAERMRSYLSAARAHPVGMEAMGLTLDAHARDTSSTIGAGVILQGDIAHLKVWPLSNVWLGVSAERQQEADERIPLLLQTPSAVRFVSLEPLLGPITLDPIDCGGGILWNALGRTKGGAIGCLDWVIVGGETGKGARPMHPAWARSLRDQCSAAGVPFFFKQFGEWAWAPDDLEHHSSGDTAFRAGKRAAGRLLDGREWNEFPARSQGG